MSHEIKALEQIIENTSTLIKETYKKAQVVTNVDEQNILNENIMKLIENCNEMTKISHSVDDLMIWEDIIDFIDDQENDEYEKKANLEFLFGYQLLRGKVCGLEKYIEKLNNE